MILSKSHLRTDLYIQRIHQGQVRLKHAPLFCCGIIPVPLNVNAAPRTKIRMLSRQHGSTMHIETMEYPLRHQVNNVVVASAMFVYLFAIPMITFLTFLVLQLTIIALCIFPLRHLRRKAKLPFARTNDDLLAAEASVIKECVKVSSHEHINLPMSVCVAGRIHDIEVHSILGYKDSPYDKPEVLVVHGTAGSSMSAIRTLDYLSEHFTLHYIDLPGFGRSPASKDLLDLTNIQVVDLYVEVLRKYITTKCSGNVCLLAHSFGGFLSTMFSDRHPELVEKLILINPAGILPSLGGTGAYWALFFKLAIPQTVLWLLGPLGTFIVHTFLECTSTPLACDYIFQLLACKAAFAHFFVGKFISIGLFRSSWTMPSLHTLLRLKVPIGFIYGEKDDIMPVHQGLVISEAVGNPLPICIVRDAGHSPQGSHPRECAIAFRYVYNAATFVSPIKAVGVIDRLSEEALVKYSGSYSVSDTINGITEQYAILRGSLVPAGRAKEVMHDRVVDADIKSLEL